jgi:acetyl esterase
LRFAAAADVHRSACYRDAVKAALLRQSAQLALREPVVRLLARRRQSGGDARLDRQVAAVLEIQRILRIPTLDAMDPVDARDFAERGLSPLDVTMVPMAEVIDTAIPGSARPIPVQIYIPPDAGPHWIVYLHGGGGVIGSIRGSEPFVRRLAARTRCTVASVDYRLGPEHKHPAAIEDACAAWDGLVPRVRAGGRIAVAGDSFGGFLSCHIDHFTRRKGARRPDLPVLLYPLIDLSLSSPSIDRLAVGYLLTRSMMQWFCNHYLHPTDDRRAASPMFFQDLRGSAPAIVCTAGFDPLVDEGDAYAERLRAAGVSVRHRRYPSLIHGYVSLAGAVAAARAAIDEVCADICELLGSR